MPSLSKIKEELEAQLLQLTRRTSEIEEDLSAPDSSDWEERAQENENDDVLQEIGEVTEQEIHSIKLALHRIETGQYGICTECGGAISAARLEALQFATTCINCA